MQKLLASLCLTIISTGSFCLYSTLKKESDARDRAAYYTELLADVKSNANCIRLELVELPDCPECGYIVVLPVGAWLLTDEPYWVCKVDMN